MKTLFIITAIAALTTYPKATFAEPVSVKVPSLNRAKRRAKN
jgi:hypothetical protein